MINRGELDKLIEEAKSNLVYLDTEVNKLITEAENCLNNNDVNGYKEALNKLKTLINKLKSLINELKNKPKLNNKTGTGGGRK